MKQYCRYCAYAYLQDENMIWCESKDEIRTDRQISRLNRCPNFKFNPIDVLNPDRVYEPAKNRKKFDGTEDHVSKAQIDLFDRPEDQIER